MDGEEGPLQQMWPRSHDKVQRPENSSGSGLSLLWYLAREVRGPRGLSDWAGLLVCSSHEPRTTVVVTRTGAPQTMFI